MVRAASLRDVSGVGGCKPGRLGFRGAASLGSLHTFSVRTTDLKILHSYGHMQKQNKV